MNDTGLDKMGNIFQEINYEAFIASAPHGVFVADELGTYVYVNDAACKTTGYQREELVGKKIVEFIYPDDQSIAIEHFLKVKETGQSSRELQYVTKSGEMRYWEVKAVKFSDTRYIGFTTDTTERKLAEIELLKKNEELKNTFAEVTSRDEELRQQLEEILSAQQESERRERKYRQLFDTSDAGIALHEIICDEAGIPINYRFIEINPAFERITGLIAANIIGKTVLEVLPETESYWIEKYGQVAQTRNTVHFEDYSRELGRHYEVTAYSPVKGQFATLVQDITERKIQEIRLFETNSYLENLIAFANGPIIVWDPCLRISRVNHAFEDLIGKSASDLVGESVEILFPAEQDQQSMRLISTTLDGVRWENAEIELLHKSGEIKTVLWNSSTIYESEGDAPIATIAQGRDVTRERLFEKEKNAAAAQIQENIAKLAILNDGIRNPLTIIGIHAGEATDNQTAKLIQNEIRRIDEMVNTLDREWIKSEKILNFLRKHDNVETGFEPEHDSDQKKGIAPIRTGQGIHQSGYNLFIEELQAQLYTILDSIDALIYVADMDTHEILYLNKQGRHSFGNIHGQKCYESFQIDTKGPCPFCTNHLLIDEHGPTGVYKWEFHNPKDSRWYDCRDRAIRWTDGRLVRLEIATDITEKKKSAEALQAKTDELDRFFNCTLDLLCIADTDGYLIKLNPEWESALGYSLAELEGKKFLDLVHQGDLESTLQAVRTLEKQTTILNFVNRYRHKDGSYRWMEWRSFPYGKTIYAAARDITDYKRHEEEIRRSEDRFKTLVNAIQETMSVISRDGTFLFANAIAAKNLSGKEPEYVIGKNIKDLVPPEKATELIRNYEQTVDTGVSYAGEVQVEMQGGIKYFYNRLIPFRFSTEEEPAVLSLSIDITEQHDIRESLTRQEEQYRRIVDTAEEGIWQMDEQKNTVYVNPRMAEMLLYTPEEMIGRNVVSFMPSDESGPHAMRMTHRMNGENDRYNQQFVRKDGFCIWMHVSATALVNPDGTFAGSFAMCTDITEQKKAEKALLKSENQFHELFENMPVAVAIYQADASGEEFIFKDFNRTGEKVEQVKRKNIIGESVREVFPGVVDLGLFEVLRRVFKTGIPEKHPISLYHDERTTRWRDNYVYKLPSGEIVVIYEDVTEQKRVELELKKLSRSLTDALNIAKMVTWEYDFKTGMFTLSDAFFKMLHMTATDAGGYQMTADSFASRYTHPTYAKQVKDTIDQALNSTDPDFELTLEGELIRPDGTTFWVTTWFRTEHDGAGTVSKLFGVNQDITRRKETELTLARSVGEYRDLANSITDVFFAMDTELRYTFWNQASEIFTGIPSRDALGKTIHEIFPGQAGKRAAEIYQDVLKNRVPKTFVNTFHNDETDFFFEISVYPSEQGISVFTKDITERKRMEERLKKATNKILLLTQINRHDIFNELTALHLTLDLAQDTDNVREIHSYLNNSKKGLLRIERVIDFTREYENFASSSSKWLSLHQIVESVREEVDLGTIVLENRVPESLEIYEEVIIQKVFKVLIENAVRHGQTLTRIKFFTFELQGNLTIVCEDDGVGIPAHEKETIFAYGHGKNTGIGLFLAKEILSVMGLTIHECGLEMKGSRFEVFVPENQWRVQE